jgi:hypothetical protein
VWQTFLPQFIEEERQRSIEYFGRETPFKRLVAGLHYLEQERLRDRGELYLDFVKKWQSWQAENLWDSLRRSIQIPFLQPSKIYPPLDSLSNNKNEQWYGGPGIGDHN